MRAALAGLTTRGRSFLAAGVALTVAALLLGERDLLRVGMFLLALPAIAVVVVTRTRYRLSCNRIIDPERVPSGRPSRVVLRLENLSRLPTGVLLVEDTLPYSLGGRPRFVLDRVEPRGIREVTYTVQSDLRGRYPIGPLAVRLTDPFGFVELSRAFRSVDHLVVTPVITTLPKLRIGGDRTGGGESQARAIAIAGEDDVATREYRQGDDLRRVHWRSTAHAGELMVRREEQPWQSRATLFLDTRDRAHHGDGPASSFEWAVSAAASIGVHLVRQRYAVHYLTDAGDELRGVGGVSDVGGGPFEGQFLDALATVRTSRTPHLETSAAAMRRGGEGVVVAVLGSLTPEDGDVLTRLRTGSRAGIAVLIHSASWIGMSERERRQATDAFTASRELLTRGGWRVLTIDHRTTLASVWPLAAMDQASAISRLEASGTKP
ncbi:MAG: hypothetical protein QOG53_2241 [Frankiales bacterium]|nr:hypothetical protein [Frankiales bacterium]